VFHHQLPSLSSAIIIGTWEISYGISIVWNCYIVDLSEVSYMSLDDTTTTTLNTCCLISCKAFKPSFSTPRLSLRPIPGDILYVVKVHLPKGNTYLAFNLVRTCKGTITRLNLDSCTRWSAYFRSLSYFCRRHCLFQKDLDCIWVISGLFGFSSEHIIQRLTTLAQASQVC
jgi:hypothetical protein